MVNGIEETEVRNIKFDLIDATGRGWTRTDRNTYKTFIGENKVMIYPDCCSHPENGWNFCWYDSNRKKSIRGVYCSKEVACRAASEYLTESN